MGRNRRGRGIGLLAISVAVAILASGCTAGGFGATIPPQQEAEFAKDTRDALGAALTSAIGLSGSSGGIAGVWAPWAGQWTSAQGTSTIGGTRAMSLADDFRIGTLTRGMTCTVLLELVDEGTVKLDTTVGELLPSVPGPGDITLGELCQGTSGLADYGAVLGGQFSTNPDRPWPPLELVTNSLALARTAAPGAAWSDAPTGYVLLGMALEAATDKSWNELYDQYVLSPLSLESTSFPGESTVAVPGAHPTGYLTPRGADGAPVCDATADVSEMSPSMTWTAGGMVSDLADTKTWVQALATGSLLDDSTRKAQWKNVSLGASSPLWQGYGLGAEQLGPLRGDSSAMAGYLTAAYTDPESGLTVVVMLNNATTGAGFVRNVAMQLASLAAKAPAVSGAKQPSIDLPWSADQAAQTLAAAAICQPAS